MDRGALLLEQVHQPVPAVGGFDHHLGARARFGHGGQDLGGVVGDPHGGQVPAVLADPHDHRAAAVQVDADVLSFRHVWSSLSRLPWFRNRECDRTRNGT